jgi:hypothetical protein
MELGRPPTRRELRARQTLRLRHAFVELLHRSDRA